MEAMKTAPGLMTLLLTVSAPLYAAVPGYHEYWDTDPPANNNWFYYDGQPPDDGNRPLLWQAQGGEQNSGYVRCPLNLMATWTYTPGAYYPAYTLGSHHPIDLHQHRTIKLSVRDVTLAGPVCNLYGGAVCFWIGEWVDNSPNPPSLSFFYFRTPLSFVADGWTANVLYITSQDADWGVLAENQGKRPVDLFYQPQQWGFGIFGSIAHPTGALGFDMFRCMPKPVAPDFDIDGDVDLGDFAYFQRCFNGPNRPPAQPGCTNASFDEDIDVDLTDFVVFQGCFNGPNRAPACFISPWLEGYSHSECLLTLGSGADGPYPGCGDDVVEFIVDGDALCVLHRNATYNCCPDDIQVSLSVEGSMLRLTEKEILRMPCTCLCCYSVEATVADLAPGAYMVVYCWQDYETGAEECRGQIVVVP